MRLRLKDEELAHLKAYLEQCPDSEYLSAREVVLDLYEIERPISINFVFVKGGIGVDGAAERASMPLSRHGYRSRIK